MFGNGKQRWKSLGTAVLEVAKCRLRDVLKADTERAYIPREPSAGRMTMAGAIAIVETEIAASRPMRPPKKSRHPKFVGTLPSADDHFTARLMERSCGQRF
jgi:hypothetical protein